LVKKILGGAEDEVPLHKKTKTMETGHQHKNKHIRQHG
jgi:hypothetical protein